MKTILYFIPLFFLCACTPQNHIGLLRSYNLYPRQTILHRELALRLRSNPRYHILIDLRAEQEFHKAHITGALNYPYPREWKRLQTFLTAQPKGATAVFYTQAGNYPRALTRFITSESSITPFYLERGFSLWTGEIEGSAAESERAQNQKRLNDNSL